MEIRIQEGRRRKGRCLRVVVVDGTMPQDADPIGIAIELFRGGQHALRSAIQDFLNHKKQEAK